MKNKGLHSYRLKREPEEKRFADAWEADNNRDIGRGILAYLLGDGKDPEYPSERDIEVAATVIQWLGSNVGQGFLRDLGYVKSDKAV